MVDRCNDLVGDGDEVWIVGDLVLGQLTVNLSAHRFRIRIRRACTELRPDTLARPQQRARGRDAPRRTLQHPDQPGTIWRVQHHELETESLH